jgi:3-oxoacyl-[acyl-carrier-protein] synthase II
VNGETYRHAPAAVVGMGIRAPGGLSVGGLWGDVCAARTHAEPYADERLPADVQVLVSRVAGFDPSAYLAAADVRRFDRVHHLAAAAATDAMATVTGDLPPPERRAVVVGTGHGGGATYEEQLVRLLRDGLRAVSPLTLPVVMLGSVAAHLSIRYGIRGPSITVSTACASGAMAIGEGVELLRRGAADIVLAGGVDAPLTYNVLSGFLRLDAMSRNVRDPAHASRPFDAERDGFVLAEGAGFVVLEREADAQRCGRDVLGTVHGYGSTADAHHLVAPPEDGDGALRCMRAALADARIPPSEVTHVNAHGTSTVLNDRTEARALSTLFDGTPPPVTSIKGTTGHPIGAAGAIEAIIAIASARHRLAPPVAGLCTPDPELDLDLVRDRPRPIADGPVLSNSFGFGGVNVSLVVGAGPVRPRTIAPPGSPPDPRRRT